MQVAPKSRLRNFVSPQPNITFCRAMLCISAAYAIVRCMSVRPSRSWTLAAETNKHIFRIFSQSGSHTKWHHSSFSVPNVMAIYSDFRRGRVECRPGGVDKNRGSQPISLSGHRIDDWWSASNDCDGPPCSLPPRISVTLFITAYIWTTTTKRREQPGNLYEAVNLKWK